MPDIPDREEAQGLADDLAHHDTIAAMAQSKRRSQAGSRSSAGPGGSFLTHEDEFEHFLEQAEKLHGHPRADATTRRYALDVLLQASRQFLDAVRKKWGGRAAGW